MRTGTIRSCFVAFSVMVICPVVALPQDRVVATGVAGGQPLIFAVAVTAGGQVFRNTITPSTDTQGTWFYDSNVFVSAGAASGHVLVGLSLSGGLRALASDGTLFEGLSGLSPSQPIQWQARENIFQSAGRVSTGATFVAIGDGGSQWIYAVASNGDVYLLDFFHTSTWSYMHTLPVGTTAAASTSWGQLKVQYRK